jgi:nucleoside 2-deoxyribosyltransferase
LRQPGYITVEVDEGNIYRITARGLDQVEGKAQYIAATPIEPTPTPPAAIAESLSRFQVHHRNPNRTAFIMMQFRDTEQHTTISEAIKNSLGKHRISGVRADDKEYHDDLFPNVLTYMHGCGFGIAVFERIEEEAFNPNVSLEIGYMLALGKPVCFLKDRTLKSLNADLIGRLYREFDSYKPDTSIPPQLNKWLNDRELT